MIDELWDESIKVQKKLLSSQTDRDYMQEIRSTANFPNSKINNETKDNKNNDQKANRQSKQLNP